MQHKMKIGSAAFLTIMVLAIMAACTGGTTGEKETPALVASLVGAVPSNGTRETGSGMGAETISVQAAGALSWSNWTPDMELVTGDGRRESSMGGPATNGICVVHQASDGNTLYTGYAPSPQWGATKVTETRTDQSSNRTPAIARVPGWGTYMVHHGGGSLSVDLWWSRTGEDCKQWWRPGSFSKAGDMMMNMASTVTPALAAYNNKLFMVYVAPPILFPPPGRMVWRSYEPSFSNATWTEDSYLPGLLKTDMAPAMAEYKGKLYLVYKDVTSPGLYVVIYDGVSWSTSVVIPGVQSKTGASLAVYGGLLHMVYVLPGNSNTIMYSQFDGSTWTPGHYIMDRYGFPKTTKNPPSIGATFDGLVLVHDAADGSKKIYYSMMQ